MAISKKVLFVSGTPWASSYYRMTQAANLLRNSGFILETTFFDKIDPSRLIAFDQDALKNKERHLDLKKFDTVIFQLVWHEALLTAIELLKSSGVKTVMEVDDDYFALPFDNPSWISFHPKIALHQRGNGQIQGTKFRFNVNNKISNFKKALQLVDLIQVSTPELAETYSSYGEIVILENCIENELYDVIPRRMNKKPVLGWFGTRTHRADLALVSGCYPPQEQFKLLLAGWPEVRLLLFGDFKNIELIPPYKIAELPSIIKKCDFGIVPLVDCKFNAGKSDLKGLEFAAAGLPVIASDVAPYRRWIKHGENGFLVKKNKVKFWLRYIKQLIDDPELCRTMGAEAKKDAMKRDIRNNLDNWVKAHFV